jgi:hypothetical protein
MKNFAQYINEATAPKLKLNYKLADRMKTANRSDPVEYVVFNDASPRKEVVGAVTEVEVEGRKTGGWYAHVDKNYLKSIGLKPKTTKTGRLGIHGHQDIRGTSRSVPDAVNTIEREIEELRKNN